MCGRKFSWFHLSLGIATALVLHAAVLWWTRDLPVRTEASANESTFAAFRSIPGNSADRTMFIMGELPRARIVIMDDSLSWNARWETPVLEEGVSLASRSAVYFDRETFDVSDRRIYPYISLQH